MVHPHACGEHTSNQSSKLDIPGSSPRLWGTLQTPGVQYNPERFIPTPVGNTRYLSGAIFSASVHPHACGEHLTIDLTSFSRSGSSPRLWGTQLLTGLEGQRRRFIPTPVGNTNEVAHRQNSGSVHPHACGEHSSSVVSGIALTGSSPRLWGTPSVRAGRRAILRFIPTPVGNTSLRLFQSVGETVHPHACGEHAIDILRKGTDCGSSPRLWGTQLPAGDVSVVYRFIPTPVGNTSLRLFQSVGETVHPHACGEHDFSGWRRRVLTGSSPRLWGTPLPQFSPQFVYRFIPTPVGNTAPRLQR